MESSLIIQVLGESFELLPTRGVYWVKEETLIISDLHLGKDQVFRKNGVAIPGTTKADLLRLEKMVSAVEPKQVVFLGDLFHSFKREDQEGLLTLMAKYPLEWVYIQGNHDPQNPGWGSGSGVQFLDKLEIEPFLFVHDGAGIESDLFIIQGHIHPRVSLRLGPNQWNRYPCLAISENKMILPAFGSFTGGYKLRKGDFERVFLFTDEKCFEVPRAKFSELLKY